ncbi:hypothetical protein GGI12_002625 [Dipsacomyces acuminosporus]|nr:hypothetical protein GGI12_002625 [Dipsacomyces acuminosporus]
MSEPFYAQAVVEDVASSYLQPGAPVRPKRAQVKNACVNCQKACKKCDPGRPCQRCIKYNLTDTCVDSKRKPRKKGIKRGPYKKRKKQLLESSQVPASTGSRGRASSASSGARSSANHLTIVLPTEMKRQHETIGPRGVPILQKGADEGYRSYTGFSRAREISSSVDSNVVSPTTPLFGLSGRATSDSDSHLIQLSPIKDPAGTDGRLPSCSTSERFRLPPIESFDYGPRPAFPAREPLQQPTRYISDRLSPQASVAESPSTPLSMLSDIALTTTGAESPSLSTAASASSTVPPSARYGSFPSKYIPLSTSRFDYSYRIPPRMRNEESAASSPWESPIPTALSSHACNTPSGKNVDNTAGSSFAVEQSTESVPSMSRRDRQMRRLSQILNQTHLDQQNNVESADAKYTQGKRQEFTPEPSMHWIQTSETADNPNATTHDASTAAPSGRATPGLGIESQWPESPAPGSSRTGAMHSAGQHKKSLSAYKL